MDVTVFLCKGLLMSQDTSVAQSSIEGNSQSIRLPVYSVCHESSSIHSVLITLLRLSSSQDLPRKLLQKNIQSVNYSIANLYTQDMIATVILCIHSCRL